MKTCRRCVLNDNIPSVSINDDGICNYCLKYGQNSDTASFCEAEKKERQFIEQCSRFRDLPYQAVLAFSGGKDSTYALYLLRRKYELSVLTVTFDNGFLSEKCRKNIHEVTANLDADNITIKPSFSSLAKVFNYAGSMEIYPRKALERASSICTACIGFVKASIYKEAIIRRIPFAAFGWTPGQVNLKASLVKLDCKMILANQKQIEEPITKKFGQRYGKYFISKQWLEDNSENIPSFVYPLIFNQYNEEMILDTIKSIGWEKPDNTDMNSTNCLLNSYANLLHSGIYGYNPYNLEIAGLVREGCMSRDEGLRKIEYPGEDSVINYVKSVLDKY